MEEIEALATMRALEEARTRANNGGAFDRLLETNDGAQWKSGMRRVQFDVVPQFADELDAFCAGLHVSKREFLVSAVTDAMNRADNVYRKVLADRGAADRGHETFFKGSGQEEAQC